MSRAMGFIQSLHSNEGYVKVCFQNYVLVSMKQSACLDLHSFSNSTM